uniref:Alpha-carbonic anhydrase domain-containing protein n=1 Tax=Steinernema glaseri TaxID=37863 RepID=A0A1I7YWI2_9BILA
MPAKRKSGSKTKTTPGIKKAEKLGSKQSPIDITKDIVDYDRKLRASALKLKYVAGDTESVEVNDHGFTCWMKENCSTTLSGSHLPGTYQLIQFHAHWGGSRRCGSEHLLEGRQFGGELHCVFWNKKYGSFENATRNSDGCTVVAIFLVEGKNDHEGFQPVVTAVQKAREGEGRTDVAKDFDLATLFPDRLSYYTYQGSLTTPPYTECIIWTVLRRPITLGKNQLNVLRQIVTNNFRSPQLVNRRRVRSSFILIGKNEKEGSQKNNSASS